jgi:hypothetical protein
MTKSLGAVSNVSEIRSLIPAIEQLREEPLRAAIAAAWLEALRSSPYESLREVPQSPLMVDRPLLDHINEVNRLCLEFIETAANGYRLTVDRDLALATAIAHDVDKPMLFRRLDDGQFGVADGRDLNEHGAIGADVLLRNGVPETIAGLVRVHSAFASTGLPGTVEGTIVHYSDFLANDLACHQVGAPPIHSSVDLVHR